MDGKIRGPTRLKTDLLKRVGASVIRVMEYYEDFVENRSKLTGGPARQSQVISDQSKGDALEYGK